MKGIKTALGVVVFILILVKSDSSLLGQQANAQMFLNNLRAEEWVEFKGTAQSNSAIVLHEIKVIYGEVEEDDWEINGMIDSVGTEEKRVYMLSLPIKFDKDTEFNKALKSFSDLKSGTFVEIEGSFLQDGTFMASEIGVEKPKKEEEDMVEWKGKVQSVQPESNSFTILGHTAILTPETIIKSLIHN